MPIRQMLAVLLMYTTHVRGILIGSAAMTKFLSSLNSKAFLLDTPWGPWHVIMYQDDLAQAKAQFPVCPRNEPGMRTMLFASS